MRTILSVLPFTALTFLCWGVYGPVLHHGKDAMGDPKIVSSLRQLICVGIAYFLIAVVVPIVLLKTKGEKGHWSLGGLIWAMMGGACGALGALGIISALNNGGSPVYVMPLVFGCAPVVNTFVTMWMTKTFKQAPKVFFVGVGAVAIGAAGVMYFGTAGSSTSSSPSFGDLPLKQCVMILLSIGLTGLCWGSYGSVLHKGQAKLGDSRLRALLCVGLAYFLIAVLVPTSLLSAGSWETTDWQWSGAWFSLAAGACGAFGALGIILSFNFGGKPVYVMPLVFGGAPVVNTVVTMTEKGTLADIPVMFLVSLVVVISGAVTVLVFAPKPGKKKPKPTKDPKEQTPEKKEPESKPVVAKPGTPELTSEGDLRTADKLENDDKPKPAETAETPAAQEEPAPEG